MMLVWFFKKSKSNFSAIKCQVMWFISDRHFEVRKGYGWKSGQSYRRTIISRMICFYMCSVRAPSVLRPWSVRAPSVLTSAPLHCLSPTGRLPCRHVTWPLAFFQRSITLLIYTALCWTRYCFFSSDRLSIISFVGRPRLVRASCWLNFQPRPTPLSVFSFLRTRLLHHHHRPSVDLQPTSTFTESLFHLHHCVLSY